MIPWSITDMFAPTTGELYGSIVQQFAAESGMVLDAKVTNLSLSSYKSSPAYTLLGLLLKTILLLFNNLN